MKSGSPKILLIVLAILFAGVVSAFLLVYMQFSDIPINGNWIAAGFVISLATSLWILILTQLFVLSKISKLHKDVKTFRKKGGQQQIKIEYSSNEIDNLNLEILAWADDRKNEIERLKKLEIYRKEFLGNVSHELKTPVFNIQGYVLTLLDGGLEDPSINKKYLERAEKSIDRIISTIGDLEAISQLETGELKLEIERFDIVALTKDVIDAQELNSTAMGIMITIPKDVVPIFVMGDAFRIRQVLVNLIVNSIKYGKEYGETQISFYERGGLVSVEVADNGIGIPAEHLPRLFERFYRVDKSRSREQGGTGLGLSIVKHIIEAHEQTLNVTSTEKEGTIFSFTLKKG